MEAPDTTLMATDNLPSKPPAKKGSRGRRVVPKDGASDGPQPDQPMTELERTRMELKKRNEEMMARLGLKQAAQELAAAVVRARAGPDSDTDEDKPSRVAKRARSAAVASAEPRQLRRSSRVPSAQKEGEARGEGEGPSTSGQAPTGPCLLSQEQYFARHGLTLPEGHIRTDGRFRGWVPDDVAAKYGIAASSAEAWEANGGGKFSRVIDKKAIPASLKAKGWSDARAFSATQLKKNPNTYFYRHTAPDEEQAQGDWSEEEHALFMATAKQYGVGDKWGLFASHIRTRVGYQCSNYYAQVLVPGGFVLDARFKLDSGGAAAFSGRGGGDD